MKNYKEELIRSMGWLGKQPNTLFLGQAVAYKGTGMTDTLREVSTEKLIELPVCEDMQMGMSIGMAMNGYTIPILILPRWNFLLVATNQLVSHLDKMNALLPKNTPRPKVIIRTGIGSESPLYPGPQHIGDFTEAYKLMCPNIDIIRCDKSEDIFPAYQKAYERTDGKSTIVVEWGDGYDPNWEVLK